MKRPVVMIVLDGWGLGAADQSNPIHVVNPPRFKWIAENYPMGSLQASGISVGLPWGEVGNSEVGHLTLGAGKVLYQYYPKIMMAVKDGSFFENAVLKDLFAHAKKNNSSVNLVGLLTKGNTHAAMEHLQALVKMGKDQSIPVNLHLFADGKDSPPKTLESFLGEVPKENLATLTGRYYAMDRNENWPLIERAYRCLTGEAGAEVTDLPAVIRAEYEKGTTEEFLPPLLIQKDKCIKDNDAVFFFNFREDSIEEITESFANPAFEKFAVKKFKNLAIATMTEYRAAFKVPVAFPADKSENPLGKVLADAGKIQLRLAETYKYAHVTSFFNGHREAPFTNEYRVVIPSSKLTHADEHPELMAPQITDRVIDAVQNQAFDFILANYSNPDTIAHTGNYQACLEAVKVVDREIGRVIDAVLATPSFLIITSDHGNMEEVLNPLTGVMETQHDKNPVPFYLLASEFKGHKFANWKNLRDETTGILSDVAPTVLELMGIPKPEDMTGRSLLESIV